MEPLIEAYKQGNLILFVGAGVSRSLGLPSWSELIDEIARQLGYDPDVFKSYGNNLALAEYYKIKKGSIGPLRSWMDREWHSKSIKIGDSEIHKLIVNGLFSRIYTTNFDRWLELAHDFYQKKYIKIASVSDLINIEEGTRQIIKFHGDFDEDDSIVFDESSYFERLDFETPLDIKLRSDVLCKSVLFIGYSLSDINIRFLFYKLAKIWKASGFVGTRPNSYVFSLHPNPVQEDILKQWDIKMVSSESDNPNEALLIFLKSLEG